MWLRGVTAALVLIASCGGASAASSWYCEPLNGYYPWVRSCPAEWQAVDPAVRAAQQQQQQRPPQLQPPQLQPPPPQPSAPPQASSTGPVPASGNTQNDPLRFPAPEAASRGDSLDPWCRGEITAVNVAVCGDDQLRALAVQRLTAFDAARSRLTADQQKALVADQNGWAMSYAQSCGVPSDVRPSLPLQPAIKDCMQRAGEARLAYLRTYGAGAPATGTNSAAPGQPPGTANPATATPAPAFATPPSPPLPDVTQAPVQAAPATPPPSLEPAAKPPSPAPANTPAPSNAPPAQTTIPSSPTPATPAAVACSPGRKCASANPSNTPSAPALDSLQGKMMLGIILLCAVTIGLWLLAFLRRGRAR